MNWLTQIRLRTFDAYKAGFTDSYSIHKALWGCFPSSAREQKRDFLTRIDPTEHEFHVWLLSKRQPEIPAWCPEGSFQTKSIPASFLEHDRYYFDLVVNPTKAIVIRDSEGEKQGRSKRVPLIKDDDLRRWLARKGEVSRIREGSPPADIPGGFRIMEDENTPLDIMTIGKSYFTGRQGNAGVHGGARFRGVLQVTDRAQFKRTYNEGIGSAKGFGFGLLLLAPVR